MATATATKLNKVRADDDGQCVFDSCPTSEDVRTVEKQKRLEMRQEVLFRKAQSKCDHLKKIDSFLKTFSGAHDSESELKISAILGFCESLDYLQKNDNDGRIVMKRWSPKYKQAIRMRITAYSATDTNEVPLKEGKCINQIQFQDREVPLTDFEND